MSVFRRYSTNTYTYSLGVIRFNEEFRKLGISCVPDLPYLDTLDLAYKCLKGKKNINKSKAPILMIHGLFGSKRNFGYVGRRISDLTGRQVRALDMRNHGSSPHAAPHNYMNMAKDTIKHIEEMRGKVILVGHSMGAKVSMLVSLLQPRLVEKLIIIDHSPVNEPLDPKFTMDLIGLCNVLKENSLKSEPRETINWKIDSILSDYEKDPLTRKFLLANIEVIPSDPNLIKCKIPVFNFMKMKTLIEMEKWPRSVTGLKYKGPVKVMRGKKSLFVLDRHIENDYPKYFPSVSVTSFDTGHWVISEDPNKFIEEAVKFIES